MKGLKYILFAFAILPFGLAYSQPQAHNQSLVYFMNAERLREANNFKGAIFEYDKAISDDPNNYKFYFQKGKCYIILRDTDNAIRCFEKTVDIKHDFAECHRRLAKLYQTKDRPDQAIKSYEHAFHYETDTKRKIEYKISIIKLLYKKNQFDRAQKHIFDAKNTDPLNPQILYFDAKYQNYIKNYEAAKNSMLIATRYIGSNDPKDVARFYYELGYAYFKLQDFKNAEAAFARSNYGMFKNKILEMTPAYFAAVASAYQKVYDFKNAREWAEFTLKMKPDFAQAHEIYAQIEEQKVDKGSVITHKRSSLELEKDPMKRFAKLAELTELEFLAGHYPEAIKYADESLRSPVKNYNIAFTKAMALLKSNNINAAIIELKALVNFPGIDLDTKAKYSFALGLALKHIGDVKNAKEAFRVASYGNFRFAGMYEFRVVSGLDGTLDVMDWGSESEVE